LNTPIWNTTIKKRRLAIDKTQKEFASLCGVSQSLIAKIEGGRVDPSYSIAVRIFETLDRLEEKESDKWAVPRTAKDVMVAKVISVKPEDKLARAKTLMLEGNFSQLPVIDKGGVMVGSVTDRLLITYDDMNGDGKVEQLMDKPFPIINKDTRLSTVRSILVDEPAVLVYDKNHLLGIITKYDLLKPNHS